MNFPDYLFVGIKGSVLALDRITGTKVWEQALKTGWTGTGGSDFVNLIRDDVFLYATTVGEVFCLDPTNGDVRWHNPLKGYGFGLASLLAAGGSQQQSVVLAEQEGRDQAAADSANFQSTHDHS